MKKLPLKFIIRMAPLAVLVIAAACQAQTMYRCGNTYSQQPCANDAKAVPIPAPGNCTDEHMRFSQYCKDQEEKKEKAMAERQNQESAERIKREYRDLADQRARAARDVVFRNEQNQKAVEAYKKQLNTQSESSIRQINERSARPAVSASQVQFNKLKCLSEIKVTLKDPESAQFSEVKRKKPATDYLMVPVAPSVWYAVTVNAKNSFGAFAGRKQQICAFDLDENKILYRREVEGFLD